MGVKLISLVDCEITVPVRGGIVTIPPSTLLDVAPGLARELESTTPVRRVISSDPEYDTVAPRLTVTEG